VGKLAQLAGTPMERFEPGILPRPGSVERGHRGDPRAFLGYRKGVFHKVIRVFYKTDSVLPFRKKGFWQSALGFPALETVLRACQKGLRAIPGYSETVFPSPEKGGHGWDIKTSGAGPMESFVWTIRHKTDSVSTFRKKGFR
jgi:hypothetical protein